jgi:phosphohistidine phosphatase
LKRLLLIRHAKSSWKLDEISDIFRPLNRRGYKEALMLSEWFVSEDLIPQLISTSPAVRTYTTALHIMDRLKLPIEALRIEPALFESGLKEYLTTICKAGAGVTSQAIVGHNETISRLMSYLMKNESPLIKTGECAVLEFNINDWKDVESASPVLKRYLFQEEK